MSHGKGEVFFQGRRNFSPIPITDEMTLGPVCQSHCGFREKSLTTASNHITTLQASPMPETHKDILVMLELLYIFLIAPSISHFNGPFPNQQTPPGP